MLRQIFLDVVSTIKDQKIIRKKDRRKIKQKKQQR